MFEGYGIARWARVAVAAGMAATASAPALAAQAGTPSTAAQTTAQTAATRTITFSEAVSIALRQNGTLLQAVNAAALDTVSVRQQKMQFLPSVQLSTSTSQSLQPFARTTTGQTSVSNVTSTAVNAGVSTSLVLFNGGANQAQLAQARLVEQAGGQTVERTRQSVVFTVVSNYLQLTGSQEQLRVRRETMASEAALLEQIRAFVQAGRRPIADQYQQQAAVAAARLALVQAQNAVELARVDLIQTLQLDPRGDYDFQPPPAGTAQAAPGTLEGLLDRALQGRADLAARQSELAATEQGVRAARAARLPTVSVSAGYNTVLNSGNDLGLFDQFAQRQGGSVSVGVSLPLFDRGSAAAETQRARITQDNARIALQNQQQQVAVEVRRAWLDWQAAGEQLAAAQAQDTAAQQSLDATQQRYRAGVGTLVELTQARSTLAQAQSQLVTARYNLVFQRTLVDYYVGNLNPDAVAIG
ncbi:MAG TPA: TolC family protein [Longimicrobium sp.]|jgi:outer membrane protein|nr:TolC family protein [Longimicrobium sp.]